MEIKYSIENFIYHRNKHKTGVKIDYKFKNQTAKKSETERKIPTRNAWND